MNTHAIYYARRSPVMGGLWHWLTTHHVGQFIAAFLITTGFAVNLAIVACGLWTVCPVEVSMSVRWAE